MTEENSTEENSEGAFDKVKKGFKKVVGGSAEVVEGTAQGVKEAVEDTKEGVEDTPDGVEKTARKREYNEAGEELEDAEDKVKAGAKAVANKLEDPDKDIDSEYQKEKTEEKWTRISPINFYAQITEIDLIFYQVCVLEML